MIVKEGLTKSCLCQFSILSTALCSKQTEGGSNQDICKILGIFVVEVLRIQLGDGILTVLFS